MEWRWAQIRSAFIRAREALPKGQRSQAAVAKRAGLPFQSAISKIENNEQLGPAVEVFLNAIEGLGLTPSEFFLQLEDASSLSTKHINKSETDPQKSVLHSGMTGSDNASADNPQAERAHALGRRRSVDLSGISPEIRAALGTLFSQLAADLALSASRDAIAPSVGARKKQSRRR